MTDAPVPIGEIVGACKLASAFIQRIFDDAPHLTPSDGIRDLPQQLDAAAATLSRLEAGEHVGLVERHWRCFHCDEVFLSEERAREHFGHYEGDTPGCIEKLKGGEFGLLRRVRQLEEQLAPFLQETGAVEVYVQGLKADHALALRREEERGYDKGVRDMADALAAKDAELARVREALRPQPTAEQLAAFIEEMAVHPKGGKMAAIAYKHCARLIRERLTGLPEDLRELLDAGKRWIAVRERRLTHYDLKGDIQMELRAAEQDLEDQLRAALTPDSATERGVG